tara:strand:- start:286 stop:393 length:108 start_codon:yes stop_codon:yes gene_type:complete
MKFLNSRNGSIPILNQANFIKEYVNFSKTGVFLEL